MTGLELLWISHPVFAGGMFVRGAVEGASKVRASRGVRVLPGPGRGRRGVQHVIDPLVVSCGGTTRKTNPEKRGVAGARAHRWTKKKVYLFCVPYSAFSGGVGLCLARNADSHVRVREYSRYLITFTPIAPPLPHPFDTSPVLGA